MENLKFKAVKKYCNAVNYFGLELNVPKEFNYIATDADGVIAFYKDKPEPSYSRWLQTTDGKEIADYRIDESCEFDFSKTLIKIEK